MESPVQSENTLSPNVNRGINRNATALWFDSRLRQAPDLFTVLRTSLGAKFRTSVKGGMVDDHIQEFILRMIHRNSLLEFLEKGVTIPDSKLVTYLKRSAWNDIRNGGTNPVCRELWGFRTPFEKVSPPKCKTSGMTVVRIPNRKGDSGSEFDLVSETDPEKTMVLGSAIEAILKALDRVFPDKGSLIREVLSLRVKGHTASEIASKLGVEVREVRGMLARVTVTATRVSGIKG